MKWVWTWIIVVIALVFISTALRSLDFKENITVAIFTLLIIILSSFGALWLLLIVWDVKI